MKTNANLHNTFLARGIKAASLAVVIGVVAVITQPAMHDMDSPVPVAAAPSAPIVAAAPDYFPSHYPAPTVAAEAMPTF